MVAHGEGDMGVKSFVHDKRVSNILKNVWYTPNVVKNLFSVPAKADKGIAYHLEKFQCSSAKENSNLVAVERHDRMYKVHLHAALPSNPVEVLVDQNQVKDIRATTISCMKSGSITATRTSQGH